MRGARLHSESLTQGVSSEKQSRHIYYMEDNQLHAFIVKL